MVVFCSSRLTECELNFLALILDIHVSIITLINLYGPNKDDPNFYETVNDTIFEHNNPHTVICGDWNLVLNDQIENHGVCKPNPSIVSFFTCIR